MFPKDLAQMCVMYALSPVHAGSGQATGAVDLPIQRERHTGWPHIQASGVKGAFRDWFYRYYEANGANCNDKREQADKLTKRVFGKEEGSEENGQGGQAGAISVSDARLLAFPVRSNIAPFVWVTCPAILTRLKRDLNLLHASMDFPKISNNWPSNKDGYISIIGEENSKVVLEDLAVSPEQTPGDLSELKTAINKLAPQITKFLIISDQNFSFLVQSATEIQPQISIELETGTAKDGSLRYQELLPSDSILYCLVFFAHERVIETPLMANIIKDHVTNAISTHVQIGGDMTLGRGLMEVAWIPGNGGSNE